MQNFQKSKPQTCYVTLKIMYEHEDTMLLDISENL